MHSSRASLKALAAPQMKYLNIREYPFPLTEKYLANLPQLQSLQTDHAATRLAVQGTKYERVVQTIETPINATFQTIALGQ
ncbi:MAG TPA: hypothetical protein V6C97_18910 [Oculatellaceae cyanobacterium]